MKPFKPPAPLATNTLIGLCVVVQAALFVGGANFENAIVASYGLIPFPIAQAVSGKLPLTTLWPTLISHIFLHAGLVHLALNMVFLAWVGRYVEWVTGRIGLLFIFLLGGLIGGALQVWASPNSLAPVIGASGSISAVFGAYAMMFARSRVAPRRVLGLEVSGDVLTALWYAASWIGLQLLIAYAFASGQGPSVAIWTHIGGFLTGLILARRWSQDEDPA